MDEIEHETIEFHRALITELRRMNTNIERVNTTLEKIHKEIEFRNGI